VLVLGFTLPVRCRAKTTRQKACGNWAYGFLFGCTKTPGHSTDKFFVQLGLKRGSETQAVGRRSAKHRSVHENQERQPGPVVAGQRQRTTDHTKAAVAVTPSVGAAPPRTGEISVELQPSRYADDTEGGPLPTASRSGSE
jgi:hypothetical protein